MVLTTEAPTELFVDVKPSAMTSAAGEVLSRIVELPVGPWTSVLLSEIDPTRLTDLELPFHLSAWSRVKAWAAAQIADGVVELSSRPDVTGVDKEIAIALTEPVGAAQQRIWRARRLHRMLPQTWPQFRNGELSDKHAEQMVDAIAGVTDPELAAEVETRALRSLGSKTAAELRKHARRILTRLDPTGAERRAKDRRDEADVSFYPDDDGVAAVVAAGPVEDARLIKEAVDAAAITAKQHGDPRPIGLLRFKAIAGWAADHVTGRTPAIPGGRPRSGGRPVEVGIVVGLDTALGAAELPGEVPGCGLVPREAIAAMIANEQAALRLLVVDEKTGRLVHRAVNRYQPTPAQIAEVKARWVTSAGPGNQVFATRCDLDHPEPYPAGATVSEQLLPADRTWHLAKTRGELSVTVNDDGSATWNTALGQSRTVTPYDYRLTDPNSEAKAEADTGPDDPQAQPREPDAA